MKPIKKSNKRSKELKLRKSKQKIKSKRSKKNTKRNKTITKHKRRAHKKKYGNGLIDSAINGLPFEMHLPGYQYCGPGTKLEDRLKRGDPGINPLDKACRIHDIAYNTSKDMKVRSLADQKLASTAWRRARSGDASLGEKTTAITVSGLMKLKSGIEKIGGELTFENVLGSAIQEASSSMKKTNPRNEKDAAKIALRAARAAVKRNSGVRKNWGKFCKYRVISIPKTGGALPLLIPLFAGLSAVGSLAGGTASVVNAISSTKNARDQLKESERHNHTMEAIAIGTKKGFGLHLKPYRKGLGVYLSPQPKSKNY